MPTKEAEVHIRPSSDLAHVDESDPTATSTTAEQHVPEGVYDTIRAVAASVIDDVVIAVEIRERDVADTGARFELEDFMRQEGYEPSRFGLE